MIRRGCSKTMRRMTTCFQPTWTAKTRDLHLHPTRWGTTLTESAVHSLVHPCCESVKIGSIPTELRRFLTGPHCVGVEKRSRAPWHRDELRDDWEPQGNSSVDVYKTWQQMATAVCFWEPQFLAFWTKYLSVLLQLTTKIVQNCTPKIVQKLTQSSKRQYSWHTLGTRLCHNESSHPDSEMDEWILHDRDTVTPISHDLKLCLFHPLSISFHSPFPYRMMRSELNWWFRSRHLWRASLQWCWLQVSVTEGAFWGSSDCSLLMPAAHPVLWIRGKNWASRLSTSLDKTTSHCYLAAQNFLTLLPSWLKLYELV